MSRLQIALNVPPAEAFCRLRQEAGWGDLPLPLAEASLARSVMGATAFVGDELAGFGRVVGDGLMYFYICDIITDTRFRKQGIASAVMEALMNAIRESASQGATLALMSARGVEPLYEKFGFQARPTPNLGAGMTQFLPPVR